MLATIEKRRMIKMEVKIHYLTRAELRQMESGINLEEITPQEYLSLLQPLTQTFTLTVPVWRGYLPEIELKAWGERAGILDGRLRLYCRRRGRTHS